MVFDDPYNNFAFMNIWLLGLNKKVQYGFPGKNGQVSDQKERT